MDIVSLIPRGRILHEGSIGDGEWVSAGQVQVQRDGNSGFSHNEINPSPQVQPMLQLWLNPAPHAAVAEYCIHRLSEGLTTVYGGDLFAAQMQVDVLNWTAGGQLTLAGESLLYVYAGQGELRADGCTQNLQRGLLIRAADIHISAPAELGILLVHYSASGRMR